MKYMGSKRRLAKHILPIILKTRKTGQYYVEPFVGGANVIENVSGNRIGSDSNKYIIAFLIAIRDGWVPIIIDEDEYNKIKNNIDSYPDHVVGYAGTCLTFGSTWFGTYARDTNNILRFVQNSINTAKKQSPKLKGVCFQSKDYMKLEIPQNSIIYCDPPYKNTVKYKDQIDYTEFWDWVRNKSNDGHTTYVSEYTYPDDFKPVFEMANKCSINGANKKNKKNMRRTEYMVVHESKFDELKLHNIKF